MMQCACTANRGGLFGATHRLVSPSDLSDEQMRMRISEVIR
jgi:hypothetical protein